MNQACLRCERVRKSFHLLVLETLVVAVREANAQVPTPDSCVSGVCSFLPLFATLVFLPPCVSQALLVLEETPAITVAIREDARMRQHDTPAWVMRLPDNHPLKYVSLTHGHSPHCVGK